MSRAREKELYRNLKGSKRRDGNFKTTLYKVNMKLVDSINMGKRIPFARVLSHLFNHFIDVIIHLFVDVFLPGAFSPLARIKRTQFQSHDNQMTGNRMRINRTNRLWTRAHSNTHTHHPTNSSIHHQGTQLVPVQRVHRIHWVAASAPEAH